MRIALAAALCLAGSIAPASGDRAAAPAMESAARGNPSGDTTWVWPVEAEVADRFRAPRSPWGPGNRGWEFDTSQGDVARAVGGGVVRFAGPVAGRGVVTIDHGGALLSSLTGLGRIDVAPGQVVGAGERVGLAGPGLHLGFRLGGRYVDPALFLEVAVHAVLVALPD